MYFTFSGAGGVGKTTLINWLTNIFSSFTKTVSLPDFYNLPSGEVSLNEIIVCLSKEKYRQNAIINKNIKDGIITFVDRTCYDPLILARTLLNYNQVIEIEDWYRNKNFIHGHHFYLVASHSIIKERRIARGSLPKSTLLKGLNLSQEQFENHLYINWIKLHQELSIPFYEIDFSSNDFLRNYENVLRILLPMVSNFKSNLEFNIIE